MVVDSPGPELHARGELLGRGGGLGRRAIEELITRHGLRPTRGLGQNYVVDPNTIEKMVRLCGVGATDTVVEIGPGLGSLTLALARRAAVVVAVERDRRVVPALAEVLAAAGVAERVKVVVADAMDLDWARDVAGPFRLVANLPYNIAAPLVLDVLAGVPAVSSMTVMVQREVGLRLVAGPGDAAVGVPSLKRAYWADAAMMMNVSRSVFFPEPRVDSVVVQITRRAPADDPARYAEVAKLIELGFRGRRKMLRSSLASAVVPEAFARSGVAVTTRAEELHIDQWCRLAREARLARGESHEAASR